MHFYYLFFQRNHLPVQCTYSNIFLYFVSHLHLQNKHLEISLAQNPHFNYFLICGVVHFAISPQAAKILKISYHFVMFRSQRSATWHFLVCHLFDLLNETVSRSFGFRTQGFLVRSFPGLYCQRVPFCFQSHKFFQ